MSVGENLVARLGSAARSGFSYLLDPAKIEQLAKEGVARYRVKTASTTHPITSLSGGNQQKVVLAATMEQGADVVVIEEPTRGVDISSKFDIYNLLRTYADSGRSVVVFCTEVPEIFGVADDVIVMSRGQIVGRVDMSQIEDVSALAERLARYENGKLTNSESDRITA
jgi:ABC-type sugar transport system ATPase subunit